MPTLRDIEPASAYDTMAAQRILITGARGFVGRHMLTHLASALPGATLHAGRADVTDEVAVTAEISGVQPHVCVHLAAVSAVPAARDDPRRAWQVNLHGTLNVASAVSRSVADCLLLFASSADAYGLSFRSSHALDETAPLAPTNTYSATKAAADLAIGAMAADGLRSVRLRAFNHIGPGQSAEFVVASFARQLARIEAGKQPPILEVGDLTPERDFLDVRDVCAAYAACIRSADTLTPGCIVNIAAGRPHRIGDVLNEMMRLSGVNARIATDAARLRRSDTPLAIGDPSLARKLLGWEPVIAWQQTLRDVLEDWRERVGGERDADQGTA